MFHLYCIKLEKLLENSSLFFKSNTYFCRRIHEICLIPRPNSYKSLADSLCFEKDVKGTRKKPVGILLASHCGGVFVQAIQRLLPVLHFVIM